MKDETIGYDPHTTLHHVGQQEQSRHICLWREGWREGERRERWGGKRERKGQGWMEGKRGREKEGVTRKECYATT